MSLLSRPMLPANVSHFPSELRVMYSAIPLPGVRSIGCPPLSAIEYRCGQPSISERKTIRPFAAQRRFVPPSVFGRDPRSVAGETQSERASPVVASAVQIDHGVLRGTRTESGAPPVPGLRTNATRFPSGDHRGD